MVGFLGLLLMFLSDPETSSLVAKGDEAFFNIDYPSAVSAYESALQAEPSQPEILWRLARTLVCTGEVADEGKQDTLFKQAERYSRMCISLDSTKAEGHTWLAGALGYLALNASSKNQLKLTREMITEIDRALALNPNDDIAYSIRGSTYRALGNVGWFKRRLAALLFGAIPDGGFEEAEVALKEAIHLAPDVMRHHYELGVLYLDWDRIAEARMVLQHAANLPVRVAIDRERLIKIKSLLAKLEE